MELVICEGRNCCTNVSRNTCKHRWTHYAAHIGDDCTQEKCDMYLVDEAGVRVTFRAQCIEWFKGLEDSLPHNWEEVEEYESSRI